MRRERPTRQSAWEFTRQCHLDAGGDINKAKRLVRERAPKQFGSIWISILVAVAFQLLKLWWNNRTTDPGVSPTADYDKTFKDMDAQCDAMKS
jgi:hypothetical protein